MTPGARGFLPSLICVARALRWTSCLPAHDSHPSPMADYRLRDALNAIFTGAVIPLRGISLEHRKVFGVHALWDAGGAPLSI